MAYSARELEKKEEKLGLQRFGSAAVFKVKHKKSGRVWEFDMSEGATNQMPLYENNDMCPDKDGPADRKPWGQLKNKTQKKDRAVGYVIFELEMEAKKEKKEKRRLKYAATRAAGGNSGSGSGASNGIGHHNEEPGQQIPSSNGGPPSAAAAELAAPIDVLTANLAEANANLAEANANLAEVEEELTEVKNELAEVKNELAVVKGELAEANTHLAEVEEELTEVKFDIHATMIHVENVAKEWQTSSLSSHAAMSQIFAVLGIKS